DRTAIQHHDDGETPPDVHTLGVWELANNISMHWPTKLPYMAKSAEAYDLYWEIVNGCQTAQTMINGDPKTYANGDIKKVNQTLATPMTLDRLITWLWDTFQIRVTKQQVYNWTHRGKIRAYKLPGMEHKIYRPK